MILSHVNMTITISRTQNREGYFYFHDFKHLDIEEIVEAMLNYKELKTSHPH